jgi:uncharacterized protein (TIGR00251 family)
MTLRIEPDPATPGVWLLAIKAVPGARRDELAGALGERLKVRISAPPEDGKANKAICALLADALGVRPSAVEVIRGHSSAEKTVRCTGVDRATLERLADG